VNTGDINAGYMAKNVYMNGTETCLF